MKALTVVLFFFLLQISPVSAISIATSKIETSSKSLFIEEKSFFSKEKPNLLYAKIKKWRQRTKRITAAVLAFPLPFGAIALHRIYLGTKPYVPVVYIATIGGVFGILPFIDFCVLLLEKDAERFNNNRKVFMWIK